MDLKQDNTDVNNDCLLQVSYEDSNTTFAAPGETGEDEIIEIIEELSFIAMYKMLAHGSYNCF